MKKVLSIFFILIICIQCLPIKQMGKCLFDNTFIEEEMAKKAIKSPCERTQDLFDQRLLFSQPVSISTEFFTANTKLHTHPVTEITTPPPNA